MTPCKIETYKEKQKINKLHKKAQNMHFHSKKDECGENVDQSKNKSSRKKKTTIKSCIFHFKGLDGCVLPALLPTIYASLS